MIQAAMVAAALVVAGEVQVPPEVEYFPGSYYHEKGHEILTYRALETWLGPSGLVALWWEGELSEDERVAILLGGSAFHDPMMLPIYIDAIARPELRVRQAAAFGYRALLGDVTPDLSGLSADEVVSRLTNEMTLMRETLRRGSLVELWLASLLDIYGQSYPGWDGIVLERPRELILRALDLLVWPEDLEVIIAAHNHLAGAGNPLLLRSLIEGLVLQPFLELPTGHRQGSGSIHLLRARERLDAWIGAHCNLDADVVLQARLAGLGMAVERPLGHEGCQVWAELVRSREPVLQALAARMLYRCGGSAVRASLTWREGKGFQRAISAAQWALP